MNPNTPAVRLSRRLSAYLRHRPDKLGLTLQPGGWVPVVALLDALARQGTPLSRAELETIVATNPKQRFAFDASGTRIRANQGHSVPVDLALPPVAPPAVLYHGTGAQAVDRVLAEGLRKMRRHHVHLSADQATARTVGQRHGPPVLFAVDAARMTADAFLFYRSANGVWLADSVPPRYLTRL